MKISELRSRWSEAASKQYNEYLNVNASRKGGFKNTPDFPSEIHIHEGRADLRGLQIDAILKGIHLDSVDLSHSKFMGWGQMSCYNKMTDCVFRSMKLDTNVRGVFTDCDFSKASMNGATIGSEFVRCDFTSANLSRTRASEVKFQECLFIGTNFTKVSYHWVKFFDCRFFKCRFRKGEIGASEFVNCDWAENEVFDVYAENTEMPAQQGGAGDPPPALS